MPALLTLRFADRPARRFTLEDGSSYLAGRATECDLRAEDDRVSRRHARFEHRDGRWRVTHLGSKNGLRVDGRPVAAAVELPERCWLSLGGLLARFERMGAAELQALAKHDRERWQTSLELRRALDPAVGLPRLLDQVLESVLRLSGAERAYVLLSGGGGLEVAAAVGAPPPAPSAPVGSGSGQGLAAGGFPGSAGAVERALSGARSVVTSDAQDDAVLAARPSVSAEGIRALVCVPLQLPHEPPGEALGVIYADSRVPGSSFTELDVELLEAFAGQAALAITVARLSRETEDLLAEVPTTWRGAPSRA